METTGVLKGHWADGLGHSTPAMQCACHERNLLEYGKPERVRIVDLMGAAIIDDSARNVDRADAADGGRHLAASIPNEGSLVRRAERPRVRNATSSTQRPRFRTAAQRRAWREGRTTNVQEAAEARLAATIAGYGVVGPTPRPGMFDPPAYVAPIIPPLTLATVRMMQRDDTWGLNHSDRAVIAVDFEQRLASDNYIAPPSVPVPELADAPDVHSFYDAATDTWTRYRRVDDSWLIDDGTDTDTLAVTEMPDTFVPMGRNADLEAMANALLASSGFFEDGATE